jgi:hypothetical protein
VTVVMQWFGKHVSTESAFCAVRAEELSWRQSALQEVLQRLGVSKTRTTPLHAQSDCTVEGSLNTIEEHLRKVVASHQWDWDERLSLFILVYTASIRRVHVISAFRSDVTQPQRVTSANSGGSCVFPRDRTRGVILM